MLTGALLTLPSRERELAAPLRHVDGFPVLGLQRGLRPTRQQQPTTGLPLHRMRTGAAAWFPRSPFHRSTRAVSSYAAAASPRVRRPLDRISLVTDPAARRGCTASPLRHVPPVHHSARPCSPSTSSGPCWVCATRLPILGDWLFSVF